MAILGKLIADHLPGDIDVDIHLIVMHHGVLVLPISV
jgi:hypothetical protein